MLSVRNLVNTTDLTADDIDQILACARTFEEVNSRTIKKLPTLRGRTVVNLFLEPSTRTKSSFELACKRLGADTLSIAGSSSAQAKGESLVDTVKTLDSMGVDMYICRAKFAGTPEVIARTSDARVINAGDGKHAHPTQALLDLYTMRKHLGRIEGLRVGIVGDSLHSRVVGSLVPALNTMGADVTLIGPKTFLPSCPEALGARATSDLDAVLPELERGLPAARAARAHGGGGHPVAARLFGDVRHRRAPGPAHAPGGQGHAPRPHQPRGRGVLGGGRRSQLAHYQPGQRGRLRPHGRDLPVAWR